MSGCVVALLAVVGCDQPDLPIASANNNGADQEQSTPIGNPPIDESDNAVDPQREPGETANPLDAATNPIARNPDEAQAGDEMIDNGTGLIRDPVRQQKRQIVSKGGVYELTFDDLKFDIEVGEPFEREKLSEDINNFDGKKIRIRGFIRPAYKENGLKSFIFVRDDKECCFGPQAAIYDCIIVKLAKGLSTNFTVIPVTIEGTFYLKEKNGPDGTIWSIFKMRNAKVL